MAMEEESLKRQQRLRAMREASSTTMDDEANRTPSSSPLLAAPLIEDSNSPRSQQTPRFEFYTDPVASFIGSRRRNFQVSPTPTPANPNPALSPLPRQPYTGNRMATPRTPPPSSSSYGTPSTTPPPVPYGSSTPHGYASSLSPNPNPNWPTDQTPPYHNNNRGFPSPSGSPGINPNPHFYRPYGSPGGFSRNPSGFNPSGFNQGGSNPSGSYPVLSNPGSSYPSGSNSIGSNNLSGLNPNSSYPSGSNHPRGVNPSFTNSSGSNPYQGGNYSPYTPNIGHLRSDMGNAGLSKSPTPRPPPSSEGNYSDIRSKPFTNSSPGGRHGSHSQFNRSPGGRNNQGGGGSSHGRMSNQRTPKGSKISAKTNPELFFKKSMLDDPWKNLVPILSGMNIEKEEEEEEGEDEDDRRYSWMPKSISCKKMKSNESRVVSPSVGPSLAESLAASFSDAVGGEY